MVKANEWILSGIVFIVINVAVWIMGITWIDYHRNKRLDQQQNYSCNELSLNQICLLPSYKISKDRKGVKLVFGIPTVKRPVKTYLKETIHSLIDGLSKDERAEALFIIMVAKPLDQEYLMEVYAKLNDTFAEHFLSGLLEIILPNFSFYPNLEKIEPNLGDSKIRTKWRTKQNLDFSYLMMYAQTRGKFYCQMEDDIVAKPGYFAAMMKFVFVQKNNKWIVLEFSSLGFIGKLFHTCDVPSVSQFITLFYKEQPVDWLLDRYLFTRVCYLGQVSFWSRCQQQKQSVRLQFKPSLFQHMGTHSSLKGKIQNLKDNDF